MKKTNYNNRQEIRISEELIRCINSPKIQSGKMLQKELQHSNFSQMVRALIVRGYEEMYTKTWLNKMFDWDNIPEVQEYRFRQNGGHLIQRRREIEKARELTKQYMDKRKAGMTTQEVDKQMNLFTLD